MILVKMSSIRLKKMDLNNAWNISTGDHSFKVGVLDTGIDKNHPDLRDRYDGELSATFVDGCPAYIS